MRSILTFLLFIGLSSGTFSRVSNYYFVFLNTNPDREELPAEQIQDLQNRHLANIDSLYRIKKLIAAGPFEGGGGMFILVAPTLDSAKRILQTDPAIVAKRFNLEVFEFNFHIGSTCAIKEPFEMTSFHFIRYFKGVVDLDQDKFENLYMHHLNLYKNMKDSIIVDGTFSKNDGFIQIINTQNSDDIKEVIRNDSLVNQNYYYSEVKKIWIGKGTFCDK